MSEICCKDIHPNISDLSVEKTFLDILSPNPQQASNSSIGENILQWILHFKHLSHLWEFLSPEFPLLLPLQRRWREENKTPIFLPLWIGNAWASVLKLFSLIHQWRKHFYWKRVMINFPLCEFFFWVVDSWSNVSFRWEFILFAYKI